MTDALVNDYKAKMRKAVEHVQGEFSSIRTGRANPGLVDKIKVDYYGSEVPLQQIAGISVPEPRVLVIAPYDKNAMKDIQKAIQSSDLGITPSDDGQVIRLVIPALTEERRKELVKVVKHQSEEGRVATRNVRRQARQDLEKLEKSGEISKDDLERVEKELDKLTHEVITEIDTLLEHKERELLVV